MLDDLQREKTTLVQPRCKAVTAKWSVILLTVAETQPHSVPKMEKLSWSVYQDILITQEHFFTATDIQKKLHMNMTRKGQAITSGNNSRSPCYGAFLPIIITKLTNYLLFPWAWTSLHHCVVITNDTNAGPCLIIHTYFHNINDQFWSQLCCQIWKFLLWKALHLHVQLNLLICWYIKTFETPYSQIFFLGNSLCIKVNLFFIIVLYLNR